MRLSAFVAGIFFGLIVTGMFVMDCSRATFGEDQVFDADGVSINLVTDGPDKAHGIWLNTPKALFAAVYESPTPIVQKCCVPFVCVYEGPAGRSDRTNQWPHALRMDDSGKVLLQIGGDREAVRILEMSEVIKLVKDDEQRRRARREKRGENAPDEVALVR